MKRRIGRTLVGQAVELTNPERENFEQFIRDNAAHCERVAVAGSGVGRSLAICGAGPSLADNTVMLQEIDEVWGCNSAAIWLHDEGHPVNYGFTVDQTVEMLDEWSNPPPIGYLVASSVRPELVRHLLDHGRELTFFHNFVGLAGPPMELDGKWVPYEHWLYDRFYPDTVRVGSALNSVTRAIDLAMFMGFRPIHVLGADCALRVLRPMPDTEFGTPEHKRWLEEDVVMHADGSSALRSGATHVTMHGTIDGRHWESKPDLWVTAVWLVQMARAIPHLNLVGDTLPNALIDKPDSFLDELPHLQGADGIPRNFDIDAQTAYWPYDNDTRAA